jgi:hypothetical protein
METIPYRKSKLYVKTIPKGTLLFRLVKKVNQDELRGIPIEDDKRCIIPNHNVFFYPNPFVAKVALQLWVKYSKFMNVYILKKDVKVIWLLEPSKYSRVSKNTKRNFIKRCATIKKKNCLPNKPSGILGNFNPCFSDTIIKRHPDIVGMIGLSENDGARIREGIQTNKFKRVLKYFHLAKDANGSNSIPELILHPLVSRPSKDVIVSPTDKLENNYEYYKTFSTDDQDKLRDFMEKYAVYNPDTLFYTMKNRALP